MNKCTSKINSAREERVIMQIQNIIIYSLVVITNSNQMTLLHMTIYSHTSITKYNEKRRGVEGDSK